MTILFSRVLNNPYFKDRVSAEVYKASMFGLVIGSNYGANLTLIGALAGIMWSSILQRNEITMQYTKFLKYGVIVMPAVITTTCLVFFIEQVLREGWN